MQVSIGLPSTIPGVPGELLFEWAQHAEVAPFTSLGVIGRLVYPNYEPLITLAAMASILRYKTTGALKSSGKLREELEGRVLSGSPTLGWGQKQGSASRPISWSTMPSGDRRQRQ